MGLTYPVTQFYMQTILEAIKDLREYDHAFLTKGGVQDFAKRFGITGLSTYEAVSNPQEFKGLTFWKDGKPLPKGTRREGQDAAIMAMEICKKLGVEYPSFHGRGSQLTGCCDALEKHFSKAS